MLALFDFAFEILEKFSFSFGTVVNRIRNFLKETISPRARCCRISHPLYDRASARIQTG